VLGTWCITAGLIAAGAASWPTYAEAQPDSQTVWMKSRVQLKYKAKYRVKNWASYDRALVQRSNVTVWLSPEALVEWTPPSVGKRGGQLKYSTLAIETALTLRPSCPLIRPPA
jgi:hypothetical protein